MKEPMAPALVLVIAGVVLVMVLARYAPRAAGWIVLALTIGLLGLAAQKGVLHT